MPLSRWLFLTVPAFVISAVLLAFTIRSLLRTLSRSTVAAVPLQQTQTFRLPDAGPYDLYVEGGFATNDFAGLDYQLADGNGRDVPLRLVLFRTSVRSFSRARLQVRSFEAEAPGVFTLRVTGIHPGSSPVDRILINRPVRSALVLHILGLIALGVVMMGSMVTTGLLVFGPDKGGPR